MDFKRKLKTKLYVAISYIVLGICMIATAFITKTGNSFISVFGFATLKCTKSFNVIYKIVS